MWWFKNHGYISKYTKLPRKPAFEFGVYIIKVFKDVLCLHHPGIIYWVNRHVLLWALLRTASGPEPIATAPSSQTVNQSLSYHNREAAPTSVPD